MILEKENWGGDYAILNLFDEDYRQTISKRSKIEKGLKEKRFQRKIDSILKTFSKDHTFHYFYNKYSQLKFSKKIQFLKDKEKDILKEYQLIEKNNWFPSIILKKNNLEQVSIILKAKEQYRNFFRRLDQYNIEGMSFLLEYISSALTKVYQQKIKTLNHEKKIIAKNLLLDTYILTNFSINQSHHYLLPLDGSKRIGPVEDIQKNTRELLKLFNIKDIKTSGNFGLGNAGKVFKMIKFWKNIDKGKPELNQGISIANLIDDFSLDNASDNNIKTTILNRDLLKKIERKEDVVIYGMNHSNGIRDVIAQAALDLKKYDFKNNNSGNGSYFLVASGIRYPNMLSKPLYYKSPSFIFVGRQGGEPLEKTLKGIKNNISNQVFILPEGSRHGALQFATKPIRPKFFSSYIYQLIKSKYNVSLQPIVCLSCNTFFERYLPITSVESSNYNQNIIAKVVPPIHSKTVEKLIKTQSHQALSDLYRLIWIEELRSFNKKSFVGQNSMTEVINLLNQKISLPILK